METDFLPANLAILPRVDNRELRFLFFWPLYLQPDFLSLVRSKRSGALAVLMYYTTMLFASQSRYWFMEGWGERLMQACFEELEQDWLPAVKWPASFINHNPTFGLFANLAHTRQIGSASSQVPGSSNPTHAQRRAIEVPHLQYGTHEGGVEASMVPYTQHATSPRSLHEQTPAGIKHAEHPGPARNAT